MGTVCSRAHLLMCVFFFLVLCIANTAWTQTVPALERSSTCTSCAPTGWTVSAPSPDIVTGDGPWPGGSYTLSEIGSAEFGSNMSFLLHNNGGVVEALSTNVTGLLPNTDYKYDVRTQGCRIFNNSFTYDADNATFVMTANGSTSTYAASINDAWSDLSVVFTSTATGTATIRLSAGNTDSPNAFGTCVVVDAPERVLVPVSGPVDLINPPDNSLTNDNTPDVSGTGTAGYTVSIEIIDTNNVIVQNPSQSIDAAGNWSFTATTLPDGTYTVLARSDNATSTDPSVDGPHTFTIDTTAPMVTLLTPADMSQTNDNTPTLSGTAEVGSSMTVTIEDSNGTIQSFNPTVDGAGNWTIDAAQLADGPYRAIATATDAAGNVATAGPNSFTVDTIAPAVTLVTPPDNSTTNDNTPTLSGTAEPGSTLSVVISDSNGAVQTLNPTVDGAGNWTIDAAQLADGPYSVIATATDAAGNTANAGPNTFTVDTVLPTVTLITPVNSSTTNDNTPTLSGTAEPGSTLSVVISDSNGAVQTLNPTVDGAGNWSIDAAQLADGPYSATATATDAAGNTATAGPNAFTVDTTPPGLSITTPADNSLINTPDFTTTGTSDPGQIITITLIDDQGNTVKSQTTGTDAQGDWTTQLTTVPDGTYTLLASTPDAAGNIATSSITITVDTTAPAVTLDTPVNMTNTNDDTPTISGTAEQNSTVTLVVVDANGVVVETLNPNLDAQGNYTIDAAQLAEGTYNVTATATDAAGNMATAGPNQFTIDLTDPTVAITNPSNNSTTADPRPTPQGTSDASSRVEITVRDSAGMVVFTDTVTADAATGAWDSALTSDLIDGQYTIEAIATDLAGNSASTTNTFTIDTTVLPLDITAPTSGTSLTSNTPEITGTTQANQPVTVIITDNQGAVVETLMANADANGDWSVTTAMLADGNYTATAEVTNAAGTTSTANTTFTVDTVPPTLTVIAPVDGTNTSDNTPTINGTTDPGASVTLVIKDDAGNVIETLMPTVNAQGTWTIDASQLADGDYTLEASAQDDAGNQTGASPIGFSIDTTAPTLNIVTPTQDQLFGTRTVDVTGTVDVGEDVLVEILDANGLVVQTQSVAADANGDWTLTTNMLANGPYTARATSTDAAGNVSTDSRNFSVDSAEPLIQINAPTDGSTTNNTQPMIVGKADADATVVVNIKDAAGNILATFTPMVDVNGDWSITPDQALADGTVTIEATATRPNGKMATASTNVTIDTAAPTPTIVTPADGMKSNNTQPVISGTSEPNSEVVITVTNAAGTVVFEGTVTTDAAGDWNITPDVLADDQYTINVVSTDAAGNTGSAGPSGFEVDTNAPTVTITTPEAMSTIDTSTPTITGTSEPGATVEIFVDGQSVGETTAGADGTWTFALPEDKALDQGEHTIEAKTTDDAGNTGASGEIKVTFTIPKQPIVITSPTDGEGIEGPNVTVSGTGEPGDMITVTIGDKKSTVTVDDQGNWSTTVNDVLDGEQTITAQSGDETATINVTVSTPDATSFTVTGGPSCSSTQSNPTSALWMLGLFGLLLVRVRRRK